MLLMKKIKKIFGISLVLFMLPLMLLFMMMGGEGQTSYGSNANFTGEYTPDLPLFPEIKGTGNIPDIVAQMAVGTAVKYRLLPSVILSQWAYESAWGKSAPATRDNNFFGITWFTNCGFPQGTPRGVGGSEGGNYMKFDNMSANFSYYGYMVAKQPNFNASVGNTSPSECLLILGRGGYAAAGITESSAYYKACLGIIESNNLTSYDDFAIKNWGSDQSSSGSLGSGKGNVSIMESNK